MKTNQPLVSVLIACYNHDKYIDKSLDSVRQDSYSNKEIVIIDDGSTDNSDLVIREWIKRYEQEIKITYRTRPNKGVCATVNELIDLCEGKYIVLLASDDALFNDTITERVDLLEQNEERGKLVLVSDAIVIDGENNVLLQSSMSEYNSGNKDNYKTEDGILSETILNPSISGATVVINKKIYNIIGKYPENLNAEDWFFYQRAASIKSILFYDKQVSLYRVHGLNTSGMNTSRKTRIRLYRSIILTFFMNLRWFPTLRFKLIATKELLRYIYLYSRIKLFKK